MKDISGIEQMRIDSTARAVLLSGTDLSAKMGRLRLWGEDETKAEL